MPREEHPVKMDRKKKRRMSAKMPGIKVPGDGNTTFHYTRGITRRGAAKRVRARARPKHRDSGQGARNKGGIRFVSVLFIRNLELSSRSIARPDRVYSFAY